MLCGPCLVCPLAQVEAMCEQDNLSPYVIILNVRLQSGISTTTSEIAGSHWLVDAQVLSSLVPN